MGYVRNLAKMRGYNLAEANNAGEGQEAAGAGVTEEDVDRRIAAVAAGAAASDKETGNGRQSLSLSPTDGDPDVPPAAAGNPHVKSGAQGAAPRGAKVGGLDGKNKVLSKKIADFITGGDWSGITADNFTKRIVSLLGMSDSHGQSSDYIDYSVDGDRITLRLSDHHGNARNIILKGRRSDKGISLVVMDGGSNSGIRFKGRDNGWADVVEYTYDNPDAESLRKIAKGLFHAFESGSYADFTGKASVDDTRRHREAANAAYGAGYNTVSPAEMAGVRKRMLSAQQALDGIFGEHTDARRILDARNADGTYYFTAHDRSAAQAAEEARQEYEGMLQRVRDGIDDEVRQTEVVYDQRTNPETGMIQSATLRERNADGTERRVYVTGGSVVMADDGHGVDRERSDASIVVVGEDGKVEMVGPEEISGLGAAISGGQAKREAVEALRQRLAQEAADAIDGNAGAKAEQADGADNAAAVRRPAQPRPREYAAGDSVTVRNDGGNAVEAQIMDVSPDGIVIRTDSPVGGHTGIRQVSAEQLDGMAAQDGGTDSRDGQSGLNVQAAGAGEETQRPRVHLTEEQANEFISSMEDNAEAPRDIELTPDNWDKEFGNGGIVSTPLGDVKMGEHQYLKLAREGRNGKLGMIKPTLEHPDIVIEDASTAKEGDTSERKSSYVFVKALPHSS